MAVTINTVELELNDVGTYYDTEGFAYAAKVVELIDSDQTAQYVLGNTGVEPRPDKSVNIKLTEGLHCKGQIVNNPQILASARTTEIHAFILD